MSIEKLDFETIEREHIPFVTLPTTVIQKIKNPMAGFMWVYFNSLPPEWKINKSHIMAHFDISERTYQRHMSYLKSHNLIEYRRYRMPNGTLGPVTLVSLNGLNFKPDVDHDHSAKFGIVVVNHTAKNPHSGETTAVVSGTLINTITSFGSLKRKEEDINIGDSANTPKNIQFSTNKKNKPKPLSDYSKDTFFMLFYKSYPKKQKPRDAYKAFQKLDFSKIEIDDIISDIHNRLQKDDHWQEMAYIPYPATYLNSHQWEGEINNSALEAQHKKNQEKLKTDANIARIEQQSKIQADKQFQNTKDALAARKIINQVTDGQKKGMSDLKKSLGMPA
jgi:hypothetical protein